MALNKDEIDEIISRLDYLTQKAEEISQDLGNLMDHYMIYKDEMYTPASRNSYTLVRTLREASDNLKKSRTQDITSYITSWYRNLHWDMHPVVEIPEDEVTDPDYESITYQGKNVWEVIMATPSHGREKIIIHSDIARYTDVYSADPC